MQEDDALTMEKMLAALKLFDPTPPPVCEEIKVADIKKFIDSVKDCYEIKEVGRSFYLEKIQLIESKLLPEGMGVAVYSDGGLKYIRYD